MFYRYNLLLYLLCIDFFYPNGLVSGRDLFVNFYSEKEQKLFRHTRPKRALVNESYCTNYGCCQNRNDDCSLPYIRKNATCYCDIFCDQESLGHVDCCPDFWMACGMDLQRTLETRAPSKLISPSFNKNGCFRGASFYEDNAVIKENCNYCTCLENLWLCTDKVCLIREDLIEEINARDFGWKAGNYSQFWGLTLNEGREYRLGTVNPSHTLLSMNAIAGRVSVDDEFPLYFISSYKWPQYIHGPLDQKNCGASWAFSTASVAADRLAIHSEGRFTSNLSPQHLISCNSQTQNGCSGGNIENAWWFLRKHGLVSHSCYPYVMHSNNEYVTCNMSSISDERGKSHATKRCPNAIEDSNYVYQCSPPYRIPSDEREIMNEIMENGPVQAIMTVHEDFFLYKTGIYKHTDINANKPEEYQMSATHSVKIIGWGALRGPDGKKIKFWIAANSWGNSWGENGYFRIVRGENECGIENMIVAAWGQVTPSV